MKIKVLVGNRFCKEGQEVECYNLDHYPVLLCRDVKGSMFSIHKDMTDYKPSHVILPENLSKAWQEVKNAPDEHR